MGEIVDFPSNGHTGRGYLARSVEGAGPGVVVIQEWWGLVPHIEEVCDRSNDTRAEVHSPDDAARAWERTVDFFRQHPG